MIGQVAAPHGVKGWVKIHSFSDPPGQILKYAPWMIGTSEGKKEYRIADARSSGTDILVHLEGIDDRDQAASLRHSEIWVSRACFPPAEPGRFYWADLIGLRVQTEQGVVLGELVDMMETGANDVMIVRGDKERLIPFVVGEYVKEVNLTEGYLSVTWDPEF